jgi:hypothetical protein
MSTESGNRPLPLTTKINRLFDVYRSRGECEQSTAEVAASLSQLVDRVVSCDELAEIRTGALSPANDVLLGLSRHFGVPMEYLDTAGQRADDLDKQLRLLAAVRDAGVQQLALRGTSSPHALALLEVLSSCRNHEQHPAIASGSTSAPGDEPKQQAHER